MNERNNKQEDGWMSQMNSLKHGQQAALAILTDGP